MLRYLERARAPRIRAAAPGHFRPSLEALEERAVLSVTPLQFATAVVQSTEYLNSFVAEEYQDILNRTASAAEITGWRAALQAGLTPEQLDASFASSTEYLAAHGGLGATWVNSLYEEFLGRSADPSGLASQ